jgi:hypothetical protein
MLLSDVQNNSRVSLYHTSDYPLPILKTINREINIGSNIYSWTFFIADIDHILLGSDSSPNFKIQLSSNLNLV